MYRKSLLIVAILFATYALSADVLILKNQKKFEGKILQINDVDVLFKLDGNKYEIPTSAIHSIALENGTNLVYEEILNTADEDSINCMCGKMDAKKYHGKKVQHIVLGMAFAHFAMIGTAIASPNPYSGVRTAIMSENKELFSDPTYLECYKKKARRQLIGMEAIGAGVMVGLIGTFLFSSGI
jgi:hypothetical protein